MLASALTLSLPCHWLGVGWQRKQNKKKKQAHTNHHSQIKMCQHVSWLAVVSCHANAFVPPLPCLPEWSSVNSPSFQQLHRHSAFFGLPVHTQIINHKIICDLERTPQKKKKKKKDALSPSRTTFKPTFRIWAARQTSSFIAFWEWRLLIRECPASSPNPSRRPTGSVITLLSSVS